MKRLEQSKEECVTAQEWADAISYEPLTGEMRWKIRPSIRTAVGSLVGAGHLVDGYRGIGFKTRNHYAHRVAWAIFYGKYPTGQVDHINGDRTDNRITNLRDVSASTNQQNQRRARKDNACGLLGVYFHKSAKCYYAGISKNGKKTNIGGFVTPEQAHEAYLRAKREMHDGCTI